MNIDQMAHEYAKILLANPEYSPASIRDISWMLADEMKAESDKRKPKGLPEVLFEPDWSVAPDWAKWWYATSDKKFQWCSNKPYQDGCNWFVNCSAIYTLDVAPSFNYQGDWKNSLRKRP